MGDRPRNVVIENAYRDLEYHNEFFTRMGMGKDSVMIIHVRCPLSERSCYLAAD